MMKRFFLYIAFGIFLFAAGCAQKNNKDKKEEPATTTLPIPEKPKGWVSDFEHIFTKEQVEMLEATLVIREGETSDEIAIVTLNLDSNSIKTDKDFDTYSQALFNKWGLGKKRKDNGVGILICPNLRRIRIDVGKGLSSKLTSEECKTIIDSVLIPAFKNSDYYNGVLKGLAEIAKELNEKSDP